MRWLLLCLTACTVVEEVPRPVHALRLRLAPAHDLEIERADTVVRAVELEDGLRRQRWEPDTPLDLVWGVPLDVPAGAWKSWRVELDPVVVRGTAATGVPFELELDIDQLVLTAPLPVSTWRGSLVVEVARPGWADPGRVGALSGELAVVAPGDEAHGALRDELALRSTLFADLDDDGVPDEPREALAWGDAGRAGQAVGAELVWVGDGARRLATLADGTAVADQHDVSLGEDLDIQLVDATWGDGRFVAVGGMDWGLSFASTDGLSWRRRFDTSDGAWTAITFGGHRFVAVGITGRRDVSWDGLQWLPGESGEAWWTDVAFGAGRFVCVGQAGTRAWSTDGIAWTSMSAYGGDITAVTHGEPGFVSVGEYGRIAHSLDGVTWTDVDQDGSTLRDVAWGDGYLAVGAGRVLRSADGLVWTETSVPELSLRSVYWTGSRWMGIAWPDERFTSEDGVSWRSLGREDLLTLQHVAGRL